MSDNVLDVGMGIDPYKAHSYEPDMDMRRSPLLGPTPLIILVMISHVLSLREPSTDVEKM